MTLGSEDVGPSEDDIEGNMPSENGYWNDDNGRCGLLDDGGVRLWLSLLNLDRYFLVFESHEVDAEVLPAHNGRFERHGKSMLSAREGRCIVPSKSSRRDQQNSVCMENAVEHKESCGLMLERMGIACLRWCRKMKSAEKELIQPWLEYCCRN